MSTQEDIPFYFDIRYIIFGFWLVMVGIGVYLLKHFDHECSVYLTIMVVIQIIIQALIYVFKKAFGD